MVTTWKGFSGGKRGHEAGAGARCPCVARERDAGAGWCPAGGTQNIPPNFTGRRSLIGSYARFLRFRRGLLFDQAVDRGGEGWGGFGFDGVAQDDGVVGQG